MMSVDGEVYTYQLISDVLEFKKFFVKSLKLIIVSKKSVFGRFTEKKGEETTTLCCRVSNETKKYLRLMLKQNMGM